MFKKKSIKDGNLFATVFIYIIAAVLCFITLYPMFYVFIMSVSSTENVLLKNIYFWPKGFQLDSYKIIISRIQMWKAYGNTIIYVVSITVLTLITSVLMAYPLTSPKLKGKKLLVVFLLIPMYFSGGLIPQFLLMTKLNLYNNMAAMIIPRCFNIWYIILMRTYLNTIPDSLREAAVIDGANNYQMLAKIFIPLAKPILAVIAIYTIVDTIFGMVGFMRRFI